MKIVFLLGLIVSLLPEISFGITPSRVVCSNAKGAVAVRSKCRSTEKTLALDSLVKEIGLFSGANPGIPGPQGIQGAPGPAGIQGTPGNVQGPKGKIDFSACRQVTGISGNFFDVSQSFVAASAACNSTTEFVFDEKYSVSPDAAHGGSGTKAFIQAVDPTFSLGSNNEPLPYQVDVTADRTVVGGNGSYLVSVTVLCCPR